MKLFGSFPQNKFQANDIDILFKIIKPHGMNEFQLFRKKLIETKLFYPILQIENNQYNSSNLKRKFGYHLIIL